MEVQCLDFFAEKIILHNSCQNNDQKRNIRGVFLVFKCTATGGEKIKFSLDDFMAKGNWGRISDKKIEALRLTMPKTMTATPDGIISWMDFIEWLERAKTEYKKLHFLLAAMEKIKEKISNMS